MVDIFSQILYYKTKDGGKTSLLNIVPIGALLLDNKENIDFFL